MIPKSLVKCLALVAAMGCGEGDRRATTVVDSVVPWDTALARFRADLPEATALRNGYPSIDALVDTFFARLERSDQEGLWAMAMTRAEFGWLYYPTVPEAHPPYNLTPSLMWFTVEGNGQRGLSALLEERAGRELRVVDWSCPEPRVHGVNRIYAPCLVRRLQGAGDTVTERLFGPIVERHGVFKLLNTSSGL